MHVKKIRMVAEERLRWKRMTTQYIMNRVKTMKEELMFTNIPPEHNDVDDSVWTTYLRESRYDYYDDLTNYNIGIEGVRTCICIARCRFSPVQYSPALYFASPIVASIKETSELGSTVLGAWRPRNHFIPSLVFCISNIPHAANDKKRASAFALNTDADALSKIISFQ